MSACPPTAAENDLVPLPPAALRDEASFYQRYPWCLDAFPTVGDVIRHLAGELERRQAGDDGWRGEEVATNVFLLSCALADAMDDYLAGDSWDFSKAASLVPLLRPATRIVEAVLEARRRRRARRLGGLRAWRGEWDAALDGFLRSWLGGVAAGLMGEARLAALLRRDLPAALLGRRTKVPAAFHTQDLTHHDVVELASRFEARFPARDRALLVVGLRTAGSYFAPVLRAALAVRGYREVDAVTLRPKKGVTAWEQAAFERCAARRGLALVVDEPPNTGATLARAVDLLGRAGMPPRDVALLLPIHPTHRDWTRGCEALPLTRTSVVTLEPEAWHKRRLLAPEAVDRRLREYFLGRGYASASVAASPAAERFNLRLQRSSDEKFHTRLKRVYEVRLRGRHGVAETRYVLAKSVGWGWLGYHAFRAAAELSGFVPSLLGLRDGILFMEWLPQEDAPLPLDRAALVRRIAAYVALRVRTLRLPADPGPDVDARHQKGLDLLAGALSGAHGLKPVAMVKRTGLRRALAERRCPVPTLIDGKMRRQEWIDGGGVLLKTDFEQHGLGKTELNVTDPAYDLAEAVLHHGLSEVEEQALLRHYREATGDDGVGDRLFRHKLLAGTATLAAALDSLADPRLAHRHAEINRAYLEARDFLTVHTARYCARRCPIPAAVAWGSPLVVMDVDGVLDKEAFGFPSTTEAGLKAVSLLHAHGIAIALNTARTLDDVREYARAYGCVGGVAEYGSVAWDAVTGRQVSLVSPESREEMHLLADALRALPGVFLNDSYRHSLRAYAYERGRTVPVPRGLVEGILARLGLSRLAVHQTYRDTTVIAREVDKGQGLRALVRLAGRDDVETIAIGDSEPDLAMFCAASRSFAPRHVSPRNVARMLGCRIAARPYQPGLLAAVREIVHGAGESCAACAAGPSRGDDELFSELLKAADRPPVVSLLRALADPGALRAFAR